MIVFGGGGVLFALLLLVGMTALVVMVPVLLLRAARGSIRVLAPDEWPRERYERQVPERGWESPQRPSLPPVDPAEVASLRDRLGHDVRSLDPGDDPVSRQAMADASERYSMSSTLLERAGSQAQLRTAWLAAVEGLAASRVVRLRQGLDPGPALPTLTGTAPELSQPARVEIDGRSHVGGPGYEPGRPHWFPGGHYDGRQVPAGWYDAPFWPSGLLLGGLGGWALGGLAAGTMFGDGGGDWSGGGGDWSGGGGDWSGGGGDWSGGGGDWSGGGGDW